MTLSYHLDGRGLRLTRPYPVLMANDSSGVGDNARFLFHELRFTSNGLCFSYVEVMPPSTTTTEPVVNDDASDSKYTAVPAISAGCAWRASGVRLIT